MGANESTLYVLKPLTLEANYLLQYPDPVGDYKTAVAEARENFARFIVGGLEVLIESETKHPADDMRHPAILPIGETPSGTDYWFQKKGLKGAGVYRAKSSSGEIRRVKPKNIPLLKLQWYEDKPDPLVRLAYHLILALKGELPPIGKIQD